MIPAPPANVYFIVCDCGANVKFKLLYLMPITREQMPVIRDGKLVGAVTHVLVNDPTRGYGIFIENMLDTAG